MKRPSKCILEGMILVLFCLILYGCLSFRISKINNGAEVKPLPQTFTVGNTTLAEVLDTYGAPVDIIDMQGHFSILYQRVSYRGGHLSVGIPLNNILKASPKMSMEGTLQRYDSAVFVFTPEGILSDMTYQKGTNLPFWKTLWKDN